MGVGRCSRRSWYFWILIKPTTKIFCFHLNWLTVNSKNLLFHVRRQSEDLTFSADCWPIQDLNPDLPQCLKLRCYFSRELSSSVYISDMKINSFPGKKLKKIVKARQQWVQIESRCNGLVAHCMECRSKHGRWCNLAPPAPLRELIFWCVLHGNSFKIELRFI